MLEKDITKKIKEYLQQQGFFYLKISGGQYQRPGIPDIFCAKNERYYFFEVKRQGNKTSETQKKVIAEMRQHGIKAFVVYSVEEVKKIIN